METKEIKITPPDGYCVDVENSTFERIKFKKKEPTTYETVVKTLFHKKDSYCIVSGDYINKATIKNDYYKCFGNSLRATSKKQLEKLLAINKLMNVAKYLNGDWQPNWKNSEQYKYFIAICDNDIEINGTADYNSHVVYFKTYELAKQAIDILGEETIRLARLTDW